MKIPIIYFSASGNTKYIAKLIEMGLIFANLEPELIPINSLKKKKIDFEEIEVFGVGAPIYALAFAPNMLQWVKDLPKARKKLKFFLFDTNAGLPGAPIKQVRNFLEKKNYKFIGAIEIIAPTRDSVFESRAFKYVNWSRNKIEKVFQFGIKLGKIIKTGEGQIDWSNPTLFSKLFRVIFQKIEKPFYKYFGRFFGFLPERCSNCRTCEKGCPTEAITFNNRPIFNYQKCMLCFRCARNCPTNAIYFKLFPNVRYFKGPKTIRGYIAPNQILKEYQRRLFTK